MNTAFERSNTGKEEWLTPPALIRKLGEFDLDPCAPVHRPWDIAKVHYSLLDDGLAKKWEGRVFCNPPYGTKTKDWLLKCAEHGNCIALTFARTDTQMFFDCVWEKAVAVLFIKGRLRFYHVTGERGDSAGAPSVLIAYGVNNAKVLESCGIVGKYLVVNYPPMKTHILTDEQFNAPENQNRDKSIVGYRSIETN